MSTRIMLDFTATDSSLPRIRRTDRQLNAGSVALLDFTNPGMPAGWNSVNSGRIPNLAWGPLSRMIGGGTETSLEFSYYNDLLAEDGFAERTSRKALHISIDANKEYTGRRSAAIELAAAVALMRSKPDHAWYMNVWGIYTKDDGRGTAETNLRLAGVKNGASDVMTLRRGETGIGIQPNASRVGGQTKPDRSVGQFFIDGAFDELPMAPDDASSLAVWTTGSGGLSSGRVAMPSWAVQRMYVEDLTVSGNSYQQAHDMSMGLYSEVVIDPSGRYHNDTWTAPA